MPKLVEFIYFNPKEVLHKGAIAKKVAMDRLLPYTRQIAGFEQRAYLGGGKFRNGDTLLARITPCLENGKTAYVNLLDDDEIAFGSTEFIVLRAINGVSDPLYIYYLAISPWFRDIAVKSMVGSSGRQRVQQQVLENLELNMPSLTEQKRIATILGSLDDKIELNRKMNENLEQQAAALFKQWFVDFEFPDVNGNPYHSSGGKMKDSSLGMIPKCWDVAKLSNVVKFNPTERLGRGVRAKRIAMDKLVPYSKNIASYDYAEFKGGTKFRNGDTLLARITPCLENGKVAYVNLLNQDEIAFGSTEYIVMRGDSEGLSNEYVYCLASSPHFREIAIQSMVGSSGRQRVQQSVLEDYLLAVPSKDILENFSRLVKTFDMQILNNYNQSVRCQELRDSLLPRLMGGNLSYPAN